VEDYWKSSFGPAPAASEEKKEGEKKNTKPPEKHSHH